MAEKEQTFAHEQSRRNTRMRWGSMVSGSVMTVLALGLAAYMVYHKIEGIDKVVYAIAALVGVSITGRFILNYKKS